MFIPPCSLDFYQQSLMHGEYFYFILEKIRGKETYPRYHYVMQLVQALLFQMPTSSSTLSSASCSGSPVSWPSHAHCLSAFAEGQLLPLLPHLEQQHVMYRVGWGQRQGSHQRKMGILMASECCLGS